jgi:hypothetical protein
VTTDANSDHGVRRKSNKHLVVYIDDDATGSAMQVDALWS